MPYAGTSGMLRRVRVKVSITVDQDVLRAIDRLASRPRSRSRVIENATREFLAWPDRLAREARDLAILNARADHLNREMADTLAYQAATGRASCRRSSVAGGGRKV